MLPHPAEAAGVVREFCRLDYLGKRLSAEGWTDMKPLTTWSDNPAWRTFRVVLRYDQIGENAGSRSATVRVRYLSLGRFELGVGYTRMQQPEDVVFTVRGTDDGWKIDDTDRGMIEPHISKTVAIDWLEAKLKTVKDPADKISIEMALKQLQGK